MTSTLLKKALFSILTFGVVAISHAQDAVEIGQASTPPTIDGVVDETVWSEAPSFLVADPTSWLGTGLISSFEDFSITFSSVWDADSLYMLFEITDDVVTAGVEGSNWVTDNIEMSLIDPAGEYDAYFYRFAYDRDTSDIGTRAPEGYRYVSAEVTGGYVLEVAIPWNTLSNDTIDFSGYPAADKELTLSITGADLDNPEGNQWNSQEGHLHWKANSTRVLVLKNSVTPDETAPSKPSNITSSDVSYSSAIISWDEVSDSDLLGYLVLKDGALITFIDTTVYEASGLEPETDYEFQVYALDMENFSVGSDAATFTTGAQPQLKSTGIAKYAGTKANPFDDLDTWDAQPALDITHRYGVESPDFSAYFKAMWDDNNLYMVTYVKDDDVFNTDETPYRNDNVEFVFDMENERDGTSAEDVDGDLFEEDNFQYRLIPKQPAIQSGSTPAPSWKETTQTTWDLYDDAGENIIGYYIEFLIPWATLDSSSAGAFDFTPAVDNAIGLDVKVYNADLDCRLTWSSYSSSRINRDNSQFGELILKEVLTDVNTITVEDIKVYPNPAKDKIYINTPTSSNAAINIFNVTGQLVHSVNTNSSQHHMVDVSSLSGGVYFISVNYNNLNRIQKVVIKK